MDNRSDLHYRGCIHSLQTLEEPILELEPRILMMRFKQPNKALQATAAVLLVSAVVGSHNAVVAGASAPPAAVPELSR